MSLKVNPNSVNFLQPIVTKFDQTYFPGTERTALIQDPDQDVSQREITHGYDSKSKQYVKVEPAKQVTMPARLIRKDISQQLPVDVQGVIASNASNFSEWVVMTGLTDPNPKMRMDQRALDASATELLKRLKVNRNQQSPSDQLMTLVFEKAFENYSEQEQLGCITKMHQCTKVTDSIPFKVKFGVFKLQAVAASIFANSFVTLALSLYLSWQTRKIYKSVAPLIEKQVRGYYIPKAVNYTINHAPLEVIRILTLFVNVVKYVVNNPIKIRLGFLALFFCAGSYRKLVRRVEQVVLFPINLPSIILGIPGEIFWKTFSISKDVQTEIARVSKKGSDQTKGELLQEAPKAYQLWMHLLRNPENLYETA